jgi:hypothetical protein
VTSLDLIYGDIDFRIGMPYFLIMVVYIILFANLC